jgi:Domain of unknown function (DUF4328)
VQCDACGLSYSIDVNRCPQCGAAADGQQFLPLRALANILTVVLAVVVAAIAARLGLRLIGLQGTQWHGTDIVQWLDTAIGITVFGLSILFVVWFRRARINAERHGYRQRRARGWTFWGWIVPIVNLWFPFQIMGDVWRAGLPNQERGKTAWPPALWWTCWLLGGLGLGTHAKYANSGVVPHVAAGTSSASLCLLAIAGAVLIRIIRVVSYGPVGSPFAGSALS